MTKSPFGACANKPCRVSGNLGRGPGVRGVKPLEAACPSRLCNAHHLRELKALIDLEKEDWARKMQRLLRRANQMTTHPQTTRPAQPSVRSPLL
jgi:hypothetical protein